MEDTFKYIDIMINYATSQDHVPKIEHPIRIIRERLRELDHQLVYSTTQKVMVRY